jgi:hypothetical protein
VAALGGGKRIPVSVTINGTRYASTIAMMRGEPVIPVSADTRSATGIAAGDNITVELERDDAPRTVDLPADLAEALRADLAMSDRFAVLSYSNQRRHVLSITGARTTDPSPEHAPPKRVPSASSACSTNCAQADSPDRADEPWHRALDRYLSGAASRRRRTDLRCGFCSRAGNGIEPAGPA